MWRGVGVKGCMCEGGLYTRNSEMYGRVKLWRGVVCEVGECGMCGGTCIPSWWWFVDIETLIDGFL